MQRTSNATGPREKKKLPASSKDRLFASAVIGAGSLLVTGLVFAAVDAQSTQAQIAVAAEAYTPAATLAPPAAREAAPPSAEMKTAIEALKDSSKPWTMTIIGDSTGNEPNEWARLVVSDLAARTGRPVEVHTWDADMNSYADPAEISGRGEPIILWNGSASGRKGEYSLEHIESMAPERPDLLVINHGHNQINAGDATSETNEIADWATTKWENAPTIAVTLQNPSLGERADRQAGVVRALRDYWSGQDNVVIVDTWTAYEKTDNLEGLLGGDKLHPSEAGSELWAETAWKALNFDSV